MTLSFEPIGVARTPYVEKAEAPRQPGLEHGVHGTIELEPNRGLEHALDDLASWKHVWLLSYFHQAEGWRPKVLPPRSPRKRRGVLATRSPHRPNPIGLSVVRLLSVERLTLHVVGIDLLDGTPILDVKPYVAYADAIPDDDSGWVSRPEDPGREWSVGYTDRAAEQIAWLAERGVHLEERITAVLRMGPHPHAYRRIKPTDAGYRLAVREWRARFRQVGDRALVVDAIETGYRSREILRDDGGDALDVHRAFLRQFGAIV